MNGLSRIALGFQGGPVAGSLTAVGALPVVFARVPAQAARVLLLGFAAGVMLSASFFPPSILAPDAAAT